LAPPIRNWWTECKRYQKFRAENPGFTDPMPADLRTTPTSGLDPHISPASAEAQRGVTPDRIQALVDRGMEGHQWGIFGEPRVNVLLLNLDRTTLVRK
jgi:K+-transporting ATPase ATPase C chain